MAVVMNKLIILPGKVISYREIDDYWKAPDIDEDHVQEKKKVVYTGKLSQQSKSRIKKIMSSWVGALEYQLGKNGHEKLRRTDRMTFITLTLCAEQFHDDYYIKRKMFTPMLEDLKSVYGVGAYLWRAEKQKNGNLHFHIIVNKRIHWMKVRSCWNKYLRINGYVERYRNKMSKVGIEQYIRDRKPKDEKMKAKIIEAYQRNIDNNWSDPNSTDIHKIEKVKGLSDYITKYMCKDTGELKVSGRIWGCSDNLRDFKGLVVHSCYHAQEFISRLMKLGSTRKFVTDFADIFTCRNRDILSCLTDDLAVYYKSYLQCCFRVIYEGAPFRHLQMAVHDLSHLPWAMSRNSMQVANTLGTDKPKEPVQYRLWS